MIISPCISICKSDPITGYCYGCGRNNEEKRIWKDEATVLYQYNESVISITNSSSLGFELIYSWDGGDFSLDNSLFQVDGMAFLESNDLNLTGDSRLGWNNSFNIVSTTFTMDNITLGSTSKSSPDDEIWINVTKEVSVRYSYFNVSEIFVTSKNTELFGLDYDIELLKIVTESVELIVTFNAVLPSTTKGSDNISVLAFADNV